MANNYMVLDIESTDATVSPLYIMQIAYNIYDANLNVIAKKNFIINENIGRQDYFNKISLEMINTIGKHPVDVLQELSKDFDICEYIVGHNILGFDMKHIARYFEMYKIAYKFPPKVICTMKNTKYLVMSKNTKNQIKETSLSALYKFLFNSTMEDTLSHTADYDVEITYKCLYKLLQGFVLENHQRQILTELTNTSGDANPPINKNDVIVKGKINYLRNDNGTYYVNPEISTIIRNKFSPKTTPKTSPKISPHAQAPTINSL